MGNSNGSESNSSMRRSIITKLEELEHLLYAAGDLEAANSLQALRFSEELIRTIRKTLIREIQRQQASNTTWTTHWFKSFRSTKNETLSDEQVARLASLTQHWALSPEDSESLARNARTWISDPTEFWGSTSHSMGLIQRCLSDVESLEDRKKLNPIRRRIILIIVSERIQKETMRLQAEGSAKRRQRQCIMKGNFTKYLSRAVKNVIEREHHPKGLSDDEMKETSRKVIRMARYGGKWLLLEDTEALLAIPSRNSLSFEQAKLSEIELEAINMFQRSLHLNGNREELKRALSAIRNKYTNWHGIVSPDADDSIQPPQSVQRREQRLPIKHGRSGARRRKQQLQPSSTSSLQSARISATRNDSNGVSDGEARLLWDRERLGQSGTEFPDVQPPSPKRIRVAPPNSDQSIDVNSCSSADRSVPSYSEDLVHSLDDRFENRSSVRTSRPGCAFHSSVEAPVILPRTTDISDLSTVEAASGKQSVAISQWDCRSEQSHVQSERQLIQNVPTNRGLILIGPETGPETDGSAEQSLPADPRNGIRTADSPQLSSQSIQATDPPVQPSTSAREGSPHRDSRDGPLPLVADTALCQNSGHSGNDGLQRFTSNTHENLRQNTDTITNFSQSDISATNFNFNGQFDLQSSTSNPDMQSPFPIPHPEGSCSEVLRLEPELCGDMQLLHHQLTFPNRPETGLLLGSSLPREIQQLTYQPAEIFPLIGSPLSRDMQQLTYQPASYESVDSEPFTSLSLWREIQLLGDQVTSWHHVDQTLIS